MVKLVTFPANALLEAVLRVAKQLNATRYSDLRVAGHAENIKLKLTFQSVEKEATLLATALRLAVPMAALSEAASAAALAKLATLAVATATCPVSISDTRFKSHGVIF